jgi:hypothetical protein
MTTRISADTPMAVMTTRISVDAPMAMAEFNMRYRNSLAAAALSWARDGDWGGLADHIERGGVITAEIRNFLVAVLRRELAAPNNRAPTARKQRESRDRARLVLLAMADGMGREEAKNEAASKAAVNRRTIDRDFERYEANLRLDFDLMEVIAPYCQMFKLQPPATLRRNT